MKGLPVLKYTGLREVMCLDHNSHINGVIVDDVALEAMLRIEKTMSRLDVMGDDDMRRLWIEIKAPQKCDILEDTDKNGNYWYLLITGCYQEMHYMVLSNKSWVFIDLRSHQSGHGERKPDELYGNVSGALKKLERYVNALVERICINPDEYNDYVAQHLPFNKRYGMIRRKDLNAICPSYRTFEDPDHVVELVDKMNAMPIRTYDRMTLRTYMHVWRVLYEAYWTNNEFNRADVDSFENLSDIEIFEHNSKGCQIEGLNLDSEADFLKWEEENSSYHCLDVAYARIHLIPRKQGEHSYREDIDVPDGKWYLSLSYGVYGYSQDVVNMIESLLESDIGLHCYCLERLKKMANEDDWVSISPHPDKYTHDDELGNEISLPYVDDETTEEQVRRVIDATQWEPLERVALDKLIPLNDKVYDFMRKEVAEPLTMSDIRHLYERKYKKYLSVHYESGDGYFYTERDANGDYIKHYFASFNEAMRALIISGVAICKQ